MKIVILGAGYAGLTLALRLSRKGMGSCVTLVNDRPHHQLVTQLHKVAAGTSQPKDVLLKLDRLLAGTGVQLKVARVEGIDPRGRQVTLSDGTALGYDRLVVAMGSEPETFGIPGVREHAIPVQPVEQAARVQERLREMLAQAAVMPEPERRAALRVVVAGGGLTGVELAGELADHLPVQAARHGIGRSDLEIVLVEAAPHLLPGFPSGLVRKAQRILRRKGVVLREASPIQEITTQGLHLQGGECVRAALVIWAGGVRGNRLVEAAFSVGARGRALVDSFLRAKEHPDVYILGDTALAVPEGEERPVAPTAQNAVLQAKLTARNLWAERAGLPLIPYTATPLGVIVSVGQLEAVGELAMGKRLRPQLSGVPAYALKWAAEQRYRLAIGA